MAFAPFVATLLSVNTFVAAHRAAFTSSVLSKKHQRCMSCHYSLANTFLPARVRVDTAAAAAYELPTQLL